ncbi:MAG: ABC transporter permease [Anaerolineae bacterium]|nr:ABC transporter permease [Anaerolineae bacterium]
MMSHTRSEPVHNMTKFFVDLKFLWLEQMLELRRTWYWFVVFSCFLPIAMVFGFTRIGSGLTDASSLIFIISGSAIFAATNEGLYMLAVRIGTMKKEGTLIYYASLPISKTAFMVAILLSRLIITFPGMIAPLMFGAWLYGVDITLNAWGLIVILLAALALANVGMALGMLIDSLELIQIIVNILLFILAMAGPIFSPMSALPLPLQILSYALPPSYAAAALRSTLNGTMDSTFFANILVLVVMTIGGFILSARTLRWRAG